MRILGLSNITFNNTYERSIIENNTQKTGEKEEGKIINMDIEQEDNIGIKNIEEVENSDNNTVKVGNEDGQEVFLSQCTFKTTFPEEE